MLKIGDFVTPLAPHPLNGRPCRITAIYVGEHYTSVSASPLSNWPEWGVSMGPAGFEKIDAPKGWERFSPVGER